MSNLPVKFRVARINEAIEELREDFITFLKDSDYPLEERWDIFLKAPIQLSTVTNSIVELSNMYSISKNTVDRIVEDIVVQQSFRGSVLSTPELIERLEEIISWYYQDVEKMTEEESFDKTDEFIEEVKKELLEKNIKGFTIDW